jgi:acylphosphatase
VPTVRYRLLVEGRVQGVFYRDSARDIARSHGVSGFARNRSDGRVELELEGDESAVHHVIAWARQGPPRAVVTGVEVEVLAVTGEQGFRTR